MFGLSRLPAFAAIAACMLTVSACTNTSMTAPQTPATNGGSAKRVEPAKPVVIALLAPATATNAGAAQLGQALGNAARMSAGDLGDPLLQLRVYDTGGRAETARAAANKAIADGARLILGPLFSNNTKAVAGPAAENGIKVISFSTDSSIAGGPVYLSGFLPEMEARRITSFARSRGMNGMGIFYPENAAGRLALKGASTGAGSALSVQAGFERSESGITQGTADFANRVRTSGLQALFIPESGQALALIMANLDAQAINEGYQFLGHGQWNTRSTLDIEGARGGWFPAPDPAALKNFVTRYQNTYGAVPPTLAVLGYDSVQIAGQMLAEARATRSGDPFSTSALTRPQGYRGAVGPIRFGKDGLGERGLAILQVGQAVFTTLDPAPVAFGVGS